MVKMKTFLEDSKERKVQPRFSDLDGRSAGDLIPFSQPEVFDFDCSTQNFEVCSIKRDRYGVALFKSFDDPSFEPPVERGTLEPQPENGHRHSQNPEKDPRDKSKAPIALRLCLIQLLNHVNRSRDTCSCGS